MPLAIPIPGPPGADGSPGGGGGSIIRVQHIAELASLDPIELTYSPLLVDGAETTGVLLTAFGGTGASVTGPYALVGMIVGPAVGGTKGQFIFFPGLDPSGLVSFAFTFAYLATE